MDNKHQCSEHILIKGFSCPRSRQCTNKATVKRGDSWYCGIHDPEKVAERRTKGQEKKMKTLKKKMNLHLAYLKAKQRKENG